MSAVSNVAGVGRTSIVCQCMSINPRHQRALAAIDDHRVRAAICRDWLRRDFLNFVTVYEHVRRG